MTLRGTSVRRREDEPLLRGSGNYVAGVHLENAAQVYYLVSTIAHAEILSVDITDASGTVVYSGGPSNSFLCLDDGTYTLNGYDSWGDGWNGGANAAIYDGSGQLVAFLEFATGASGSVEFTLPFELVVEAPVGVFFSEYTEGASNNKYLEIFNGTGEVLSLGNFGFPSVSNAPATPGEYEYWNSFTEGATINPG